MHLPLRSRTLSSLLPLTLLLLLLSAFSGSNPPPSGRLLKSAYDPIRFSLWADRKTVAVGQVFTLTISATYQPVSSTLLETFEPASAFRLKLLLPEGFVPTGGDYHELIGTELSSARPSVSYHLTGYFVFRPAHSTFRLLRGPGSATPASLFVEATRLTLRLSPSAEPAPASLTDARGRRLAGNFEGHLDGADCSSIGGWVYDRDQPNTPLPVELLVNGQVVASQPAGTFRQDLLNAGKGDGRHGFGFQAPAALKTGQPVSVSVRVAASGYSLMGSPKTVTCAGTTPSTPTTPPPTNPSGGAYEGFLDGADCSSLGGWVYDRHQPDAPLTVEVLAGNQVVATLPAATYRADLQQAGKGNGRHGFSLEPPAGLKTGQPHAISVRVAGTDYNLTHSPRTITCAGSSSSTPSTPSNPTSSPSTNPSGGAYEGFFEGAACGSVGGWVYDRHNPNTPLTVELLANGQVVARGLAGNFRQDLLNAGKGDGRHGLSLPLPESVKTGQNLSLQLRVAGSTYLLMNGPRTVSCGGGSSAQPQNQPAGNCSVSRPRGYLDRADGGGFGGWALDESDFNKTVKVDIFVDGKKIGTVQANEDRPDLVGAFGSNPAARYHGFNAEWEYWGEGTKTGFVTARICGSGEPLPVSSTNRVQFSSARKGKNPPPTVDGGTLDVDVVIIAKRPEISGSGSGNGRDPGEGTDTGIGETSGSKGGTGSGSSGNNGNSNGPGGKNSNTKDKNERPGIYTLLGPDIPIRNLKMLLDCLFGAVPNGSNYKYSMTMYVDQPVNGKRKTYDTSREYRMPGHTYFGLEMYNSNTKKTVRSIIGFYVVSEITSLTNMYVAGTWGDDGGTPYDVSIKVDLTADQFRTVISGLKGTGAPNYHLVNNNCTTFVCNLFSPYLNLPSGTGSISILGEGKNPADLGQDLRENSSLYGDKIAVGNDLIGPISTNCDKN
ncbi:hypothetical protein [Larkinella soli]|uniref:hypothetical protein n=1 Tax=Larkinella soli TaxID=1770527 RepID=UPI000FFBF692|nr:hypothetical protein [Larkinella soli]